MDNKSNGESQLKESQKLTGKLALVTGASGGIGWAIALKLAQSGATMVIQGRNQHKLNSLAQEIGAYGVKCLVQVLDVRDEPAVDSAVKAIEQEHKNVDILVNNAGIYRTAPVLGHKTADWNDILDTNLKGAFFYSRAVIGKMLESKWGRIINISSISGKTAEIHGAAYSASKFALIGLTQALALESASNGVTVNAVCPGWVDTELSRKQLSNLEWCELNSIKVEESLAVAKLSVPQGRFIETSEVAELVAYLSSNAACGITGQSINVCGGMCLN